MKMDSDSIFYDFPAALREDMMKILPKEVSGIEVYYDTFIQYLTSRLHTNPRYDGMALGLARERLFRQTVPSFTETVFRIQQNRDVSGRMKPLLHPEFFSFMLHHRDKIDALFSGLVEEVEPFAMTYFGWKTLYRSYLLRTHEGVVERPEHLWFRIALFLHNDRWDRVADTFRLLHGGAAIHATPTLYHAGMVHPQMASCFLMGIGDSVNGIFRAVSHAAAISKYAGGIGINITNIRAKKSYIYGTNGYSNGILPMLRVFNDTSRYIDQGGGKRKGAFAMYIEPWHSDILDFVLARRNTGSEDERARDLFYGLWIPDEFMRRVEADDSWYLMSENDCPGLGRVWGERFDDLYRRYIEEGRYTTKMRARELWQEIVRSQIETGNPYILYKDTCNRMSNQQNLGTIRGSNLCCEIIEYSDENEYAVCNLASISLISCVRERDVRSLDNRLWIVGKKYCIYCQLLEGLLKKRGIRFEKHDADEVPEEHRHRLVGKTTYPIVYLDGEHAGGFSDMWRDYLCPEFDFERLGRVVKSLVINLNVIIDKNHYPLEECRRSNTRHRPIGIGVQGLADVFMAMLEPYDSDAARALNRKIFETMYYHALRASLELARADGSYESFQGSPLSRGVFHFEQFKSFDPTILSPEHDWESLRKEIVRTGIRNSLLLAPMPTASTSQILGNTESFEPLTSNFYVRRTLAGEFYVVNRFLHDLFETAGSWNEITVQSLVLYKGSVQAMDLPGRIKEVFRTVWEIPLKSQIDMAADRQMFIDQSQSFNVHLAKPDPTILTKIHFYGWRKELKTGCYYLRTRAATSSQNFTIDPEREKEICQACSA